MIDRRPVSPAPAPRTARQWWSLIAICGATFMLLIDITIVQVALPTIQRSLHADFADLQWVISAYALTLSALILSSGSLADRVGGRHWRERARRDGESRVGDAARRESERLQRTKPSRRQ